MFHVETRRGGPSRGFLVKGAGARGTPVALLLPEPSISSAFPDGAGIVSAKAALKDPKPWKMDKEEW